MVSLDLNIQTILILLGIVFFFIAILSHFIAAGIEVLCFKIGAILIFAGILLLIILLIL